MHAFEHWLPCNIGLTWNTRCGIPAMLQPMTCPNNILRSLTFGQTLRAIFALAFAVMIGAMLLTFPGPLFYKVAKIPDRSSEWSTPTLSNDSDVQTVELRNRAADALALLEAKSVTVGSAR